MRAFHIFQPPGNANALGQVKFLFPNKHDVYMHDTPTKSLFNHNVRTYSHGCMRVRDPLKFAEVMLGEDQGLDHEQIVAVGQRGPAEQRDTFEEECRSTSPISPPGSTTTANSRPSTTFTATKTASSLASKAKRISLPRRGREIYPAAGRAGRCPLCPEVLTGRNVDQEHLQLLIVREREPCARHARVRDWSCASQVCEIDA